MHQRMFAAVFDQCTSALGGIDPVKLASLSRLLSLSPGFAKRTLSSAPDAIVITIRHTTPELTNDFHYVKPITVYCTGKRGSSLAPNQSVSLGEELHGWSFGRRRNFTEPTQLQRHYSLHLTRKLGLWIGF